MPKFGGGLVGVASVFTAHYLTVWHQHIGVVELYSYAGMDYRMDLDLLALVGEPWGEIGIYIDSISIIFLLFDIFVRYEMLTCTLCLNLVDDGPKLTTGYVLPVMRGDVVVRPTARATLGGDWAEALVGGLTKVGQIHIGGACKGEPGATLLSQANEIIARLKVELAAS